MLAVDKCIAYPCTDERVKNSAFCAVHKKAHATSPWVKQFRAMMLIIAKEQKAKADR